MTGSNEMELRCGRDRAHAPLAMLQPGIKKTDGDLPTHWDSAAKALAIRVPDPLSELVPPSSPARMRENVPVTGSTLEDVPTVDILPTSIDLPSPDFECGPLFRPAVDPLPRPVLVLRDRVNQRLLRPARPRA